MINSRRKQKQQGETSERRSPLTSLFLWNWKILRSGCSLTKRYLRLTTKLNLLLMHSLFNVRMIGLNMVLATYRDGDSLGGCIHNCVFPAVLGNWMVTGYYARLICLTITLPYLT
ncbi:hypothetical protein Ddye_013195 [Dipteronia dyeriana]|uniref:Uncharacterized protein n=1 Tax=Dipteronia dyeriana TaxID=168575 RepID=A0AAD9X5V0_9ROSI|nr:hypothetical protein Ddye_013195 [Dipteronia dyeriana]